jgi:hypothetical protein
VGSSTLSIIAGWDLIRMSCAFGLPVVPSGVTLKRSSQNKNLWTFDSTLTYGEDLDLWLKIFSCCDIAYLPESLAVYRQGGMTANHSAFMHGFVSLHLVILEQYQEFLDRESANRYRKRLIGACDDSASYYQKAGNYGAAAHQYLNELDLSIQARRFFHIGRAIGGYAQSRMQGLVQTVQRAVRTLVSSA